MTTQEQLDSVNAAIRAIEGGAQEYWVAGQRVRRADINYLYAERKRLEAQLHHEQYAVTVAVFDRR